MNNSRGFIAAEFLFSIVLAAGLCIVLFSLTFTLSMAEVAQYIAFSASRAHSAAHVDQDQQEKMGQDKYKELLNTSALKNLFTADDSGWFQVSKTADIRGAGANGKTFEDYENNSIADRVPQVGVRFDFKAKILNMKVPMLGSTTGEGTDDGFTAKVTALLIREPTQKECWELQVKERYKAILSLDSRYSKLDRNGDAVYRAAAMEDNGC
jgi:hypothetical protein